MPLIPPKKGERIPGSGRKRGTQNRASVEINTLFEQCIADPAYQRKLREDFRKRRVHPLTESVVWQYRAGKPASRLDINANVSVHHRFEVEAQLLRGMALPELEALAAESQALIDRAIERMQVHNALDAQVSADSLRKDRESDKGSSVTYQPSLDPPETE